MSKWKNLLIALALPLTYIGLQEGFTLLVLSFVRHFPGSLKVLDDFMLDSLFCIFLLPIYFTFYHRLTGPEKPRIPWVKDKKKVLTYGVTCLGLGGITLAWFNLVDLLTHYKIFGFFSQSMDHFTETGLDIDKSPYIWTFLSVVFLGPIVEEVLFRGLQYQYLSRFKKGFFPIFFSSLSFGLFHGEPVQVVYTFFMGLGLALIYEDSQSLKAPILVHVLNNLLSNLPPGLNLEWFYDFIDILSLALALPCLYLLYRIYQRNHLRKTGSPLA